MKTRLVRLIYQYRRFFRRFILIRRPVLLKLSDFNMYVQLDDWAVGARIALKRNYEPHVTGYMRDLLKTGDVVVDIGANIGYYTLLAASQIGATGKVIAFEPNKANLSLLSMSLQANNFINVALHPYAVADKNGTVGYHSAEGSSNGVIGPIETTYYPIKAVTIDAFLANEPHVEIVKMDIEGAEALALTGMQQFIQRHRPIIFTEFSPRALQLRSGVFPEVYLDQFIDLNYEIFVLHRRENRILLPQSRKQIMDTFALEKIHHLDLVAFPRK